MPPEPAFSVTEPPNKAFVPVEIEDFKIPAAPFRLRCPRLLDVMFPTSSGPLNSCISILSAAVAITPSPPTSVTLVRNPAIAPDNADRMTFLPPTDASSDV